MKYFYSKIKLSKGFTIVELMVSIGIFALMTALLLAKYGTFNQGVLLTNLAYDVALSIRNAQSYGLNVKSARGLAGTVSDSFDFSYGVYFNTGSVGTIPAGKSCFPSGSCPPGNLIPNTEFVFFIDKNGNGVYDKTGNPDDETILTHKIKRGSRVARICINAYYQSCDVSSPGVNYHNVSVTFLRPDPGARINSSYSNQNVYTEIILRTNTNQEKRVVVNKAGQITIRD